MKLNVKVNTNLNQVAASALRAKPAPLLPLVAGMTTAVIWGISFLFTKDALNYTFPAQILGLRFAAAALTITFLVAFGIVKINLRGKGLGSLLVLSFVQPFLYFIGETWGVKWTTASEAGMIVGLAPVAIALMASIFLHERMRPLQIVSIGCSVLGVFVIVGAQGQLSWGEHLLGVSALFVAVISTGVYSILSKKSSQRFTPVEITYVMMWMGAVLFNLIGLAQAARQGRLLGYLAPLQHSAVVMAVLYLGVLSSVGAFFLFNYALSHLSVTQSAPLINLTTVVSVAGGVVFQHDPFGWVEAAGALLIILGVWGTNYVRRSC
ncbi:EamA domain protein [Acididesulfobacillus acetoxydans]|uniref:DMT(Drug/metabolite transporter) super permease n=1 Tax=Acididesulfobacillus acetoxydans TaxID=1561005 RepID=A0A8S0W310_9FIRM|nr:DMT family transporter [Acididesulfobacillus acetoxydans]CAA7601198.1 EamA domain protein [Acididesulfobacillus acetoxydans]CEJ08523.1 DMT(Drug/metabolite transporter) super permease [Acididesulfobacillus acetoxydans]